MPLNQCKPKLTIGLPWKAADVRTRGSLEWALGLGQPAVAKANAETGF